MSVTQGMLQRKKDREMVHLGEYKSGGERKHSAFVDHDHRKVFGKTVLRDYKKVGH